MTKIIDEIKEITAKEVARKQSAAKFNFPKIIKKIKSAATIGDSSCLIPVHDMNEYDKALLVSEGFRVSLIDQVIDRYDVYNSIASRLSKSDKIWEVKW